MHSENKLGDFTRDRRLILLSLMAIVIGAISAVVAYVLVWLIAVITNLSFYQTFSSVFRSPEANNLGLWVIIIPVIGGLIIGFTARYGSEKIRGHGIPEALEAILFGRSRMSPKVAVLKPLSSAISIGTGGPFGAEGPIIMTGGAIGSLFAQLFNLSSAERKTLLVCGRSGRNGGDFCRAGCRRLLAVELLLFEWKPRSFIPVAIASAVAGALRVPLMGAGPIFPVTPHAALGIESLIVAFVVGIIGGIASGLLTALVYACEDLFERIPIHWMWYPAIGALFVGIGGYFEPRVLGVGYDTIHSLLRGEIVGGALIGLLIGKSLVWSIALGSGTSGGVLAPLLIMGGALGAFESGFIPFGDAGIWSIISMAAVMGGTMRSPLTAMVFTLELTHDMNLLPALLVGSIAAHAFTVLVLPRSILTEKVARRGFHLTREYSIDPLTTLRVEEVMSKDVPTVPQTMKVIELSDLIARRDPHLTKFQGVPIVDEDDNLVGIITRGDVLRTLEDEIDKNMTVLEAGSRDLIVAYPDEILYEAADKMLHKNIGRLLVVKRQDNKKVSRLSRTGGNYGGAAQGISGREYPRKRS